MTRKGPVVNPASDEDKKASGVPGSPDPRRWAFSFRFWRQTEFFGLDKAQPTWFVSLLERLAELSGLVIDDFRSDAAARSYHRYHEIDWDQKNIPVRREDLTWIERRYLDHPDEFPLVQFMISKALGRVVGFWDEDEIFNIVLLDPLHNLQPSRFHSYRIDPCSPLSCEYTSLILDLERVKGQACVAAGCPVRAALEAIPSRDHRCDVMIVQVEAGTRGWVDSLIASNRVDSVSEILEAGIITIDTEQIKE